MKLSKMFITRKNLAGKASQTLAGKGHVDAWGHKGGEARLSLQEEFGGKRTHGWGVKIYTWRPRGRLGSPWWPPPGGIWREKAMWMWCKYLYQEATRETKLSKMSVTRKNWAEEVSRRWDDNIYIWRPIGRWSSPRCPSPGQEEFGGKGVT